MADLLAGLSFTLLGLFIFFKGLSLPEGTANIPGPRFWPNLIAIGLMVLGVLLAGQNIFSKSRTALNIAWRSPKFRPILFLFCITVLYLLLWGLWQFFIPTFLFLSAAMIVLNPKRILRTLLIALVFTSAVYAGFYWALHLPL